MFKLLRQMGVQSKSRSRRRTFKDSSMTWAIPMQYAYVRNGYFYNDSHTLMLT
jgi:hypothetical protein